MELARYGYTDPCIGCQHARLGFKPAQDRIVETTPLEARKRDPVPEPARKKVRFAERVAEQTPEGTLGTNSRSTLLGRKLSLNCLFARRNNNNFDLCRPPGN